MNRPSDWSDRYTAEWRALALRAETLLADERAAAIDVAVAAMLWSGVQVKINRRAEELDPDGSVRAAVSETLHKRYEK